MSLKDILTLVFDCNLDEDKIMVYARMGMNIIVDNNIHYSSPGKKKGT